MFKVGDTVKVTCKHYLSCIKDDIAYIIDSPFNRDEVFYVRNDEIDAAFPGGDGFSVDIKDLHIIKCDFGTLPIHEVIGDLMKALKYGKPGNKIETGIHPSRYNKAKIELWDVFHLLDLDAFQSSILRYIYRYEDKNGEEDLVKALNYTLKMLSLKSGDDYEDLFQMSLEELNNKYKK